MKSPEQLQFESEFFEVRKHRDVVDNMGDEPYLHSTIQVKGELSLRGDVKILHRGEPVHIRIVGPDGDILAEGAAEIQQPKFADILMDKALVGVERIHTAKLP